MDIKIKVLADSIQLLNKTLKSVMQEIELLQKRIKTLEDNYSDSLKNNR